jgi:LDH2 family malate/lactate/ureidoglycolate dehydrogenase
MPNTLVFNHEALKNYIIRFFTALDVPEIDARIAADVLISADLRGVDTHGVIRLSSYYGDRLLKGLIDSCSTINTINESAATLALDGGNGLGQVVAYRSMSRCIEKAEEAGICITTVRNSNHFGIAGYFAMMALPEDMIGISLTNSQPLVTPTFGIKRMIGTNPIAVAIPSGREKPFVLDMATSIVSFGKIQLHKKSGQDIPKGWAINQQGELTDQPDEVIDGGSLLPLGGPAELRGYKGYGLSILVDMLTGILAGAAFGTQVGQPSKDQNADVGHFFAAIKIENFRPVDLFKNDMDEYIRSLKASPKIPGQDRIYIHGEKEFEKAEVAMKSGIPLLPEVVDSLKTAGKKIGIPFDLEPLH